MKTGRASDPARAALASRRCLMASSAAAADRGLQAFPLACQPGGCAGSAEAPVGVSDGDVIPA